jgi:hypothetical protein
LKNSLHLPKRGAYLLKACARPTPAILIRLKDPELEVLKERIDDVLDSFFSKLNLKYLIDDKEELKENLSQIGIKINIPDHIKLTEVFITYEHKVTV